MDHSNSSENGDVDLEEMTRFIASKPLVFERWIQEKASPSTRERIRQITSKKSESIRNSTTDIFQSYANVSPCKVNHLFMDHYCTFRE